MELIEIEDDNFLKTPGPLSFIVSHENKLESLKDNQL